MMKSYPDCFSRFRVAVPKNRQSLRDRRFRTDRSGVCFMGCQFCLRRVVPVPCGKTAVCRAGLPRSAVRPSCRTGRTVSSGSLWSFCPFPASARCRAATVARQTVSVRDCVLWCLPMGGSVRHFPRPVSAYPLPCFPLLAGPRFPRRLLPPLLFIGLFRYFHSPVRRKHPDT